ncbi:alpha/beta hydrolase [Sulfitobacter guttiformis]|uniref:Serine aminopeptidase S33 family n=1 Tax=Sulfitobacter guttiformis TaxID=74349 RepID=A0A420DMR8_9RHOB|nr:alpha/beta fold hydrolase [Sulfitobacter guttiformis]KIN72888.1 Alpha/beta hydrolase [Sulfitobacter guttiformis KCTC 32187]RKE95576.1 serine aminopeptidase S33 family [Sulfitobacter guttiformis]
MIIRTLQSLCIAAALLLALAIGLVFTRYPDQRDDAGSLDFSQLSDADMETAAALQGVAMRDGYSLQVRTYGGADDVPLLVMVHGSGWHGLQFDSLADGLSENADVVVPDLRGHGTAPDRRGDVDYIGQLEDDLADLIATLAKPGQAVIMAGHSSGGGLVVRFAGGAHGHLLDGAVLMAPFLKYNAPTMRENAGGWSNALTRRIIGLNMLNGVGITVLNDRPVVQLNMPESVVSGPLGGTATLSYSYRLNRSFAPRSDYLEDIAALPRFILLAGGADEAFVSSQYAPTMGAVTDKGRFDMILGATHLGLVNDPRTLGILKGFLDEY